MIITVMKRKVLINKRTGKKLVLDLDNPEDKILSLEESRNSTFSKKRFDNTGLSEKIFSDFDENDDDYPSQEEIEREVEEALER